MHKYSLTSSQVRKAVNTEAYIRISKYTQLLIAHREKITFCVCVFLSWYHRDSLRSCSLWTDSCTVCYRYIHKKFNPPVTSRWVYDRTTRNHFRERKEHASNHGKKSIDVCFHSLQKSCLLHVARYTCSRWLVLSDVTIFFTQTNAKVALLCHITLVRPWRFCY